MLSSRVFDESDETATASKLETGHSGRTQMAEKKNRHVGKPLLI